MQSGSGDVADEGVARQNQPRRGDLKAETVGRGSVDVDAVEEASVIRPAELLLRDPAP